MSLFKKIAGIIGTTFQIDTINGGPKLKNSSGVLEARNAADDAYAKVRALHIATSPNLNDVPTVLGSQAKVIQFSFNGASVPAAGTNTGKFGFCHTTGGSYTAADVVYDDGSNLIKLAREDCKVIYTSDAVSGTISLAEDGVYGWETSAYVLKGDGAATGTGFFKAIEVSFDYTDGNVDSTTSIPSGARAVKTSVRYDTPFNGTAPTVAVSINGSTPLALVATSESNPKVANEYVVEATKEVAAANAGVVRVAVTPDSSSAGAGKVIVEYVSPGV